MRTTAMLILGLLALLLPLGAADALTGANGYESTFLFDEADVAALSDWSEFATITGPNFGAGIGNDVIAIDSSNRVYLAVRGYDTVDDLTWYDGVVRVASDGSSLETVDRFAMDWVDVAGTGWVSYGGIQGIAVAFVRVPSTGNLEERLVVARTGRDGSGSRVIDVVAYELSAGTGGAFATESLCSWATVDGSFGFHMAIDSSAGNVYVQQNMPGTTEPHDGSIRAFEWNTSSAAYLERSQPVTSSQVGYRDLTFHGGYLYTFDYANRGSSSRSDPILQVDPSGSDSTSSYASMRQSASEGSYYSWASAGSSFYIAEWITKKRQKSGEITVITAGQTTSSDARIATFGTDRLAAMAGAADGSLAVMTWSGVYLLAPGGDTGGGGGNGGGKGKNK